MTGEFLPPQLIYQGKTSRCLPSVEFPDDWHITYSINHWSNEGTIKECLCRTYPTTYIDGKRKSLNLASKFPALVLFNNFKAQCTSDILTLLDQNNINVVLIPPNCTDCLQPLDISINKAVKDHLRGQFQSWYTGEIYYCYKEQKEKEPVDLRMSVVKPLSATLMISTCNYISNKLLRMDFRRPALFTISKTITDW